MTAAERIAAEFHEAYEALAPAYGYKTREESAVVWENVPDANRRLMIAVVQDLLSRNVIEAGTIGDTAAIELLPDEEVEEVATPDARGAASDAYRSLTERDASPPA